MLISNSTGPTVSIGFMVILSWETKLKSEMNAVWWRINEVKILNGDLNHPSEIHDELRRR